MRPDRKLYYLALALFACSLLSPGYQVEHQQHLGWHLIFLGVLGPLDGHFAWFANPLLCYAWIAYRRGQATTVVVVSTCALGIGLTLLGYDTIAVGSAGFSRFHIRFGYWVWLASIGMTIIAGFVAARTPRVIDLETNGRPAAIPLWRNEGALFMAAQVSWCIALGLPIFTSLNNQLIGLTMATYSVIGVLGWHAVWAAHPLLLGAWIAKRRRKNGVATALSASALLAALMMPFDAGMLDQFTGGAVFRIAYGYWVWLASIVAMIASAWIGHTTHADR